jgi:hypothetical protein
MFACDQLFFMSCLFQETIYSRLWIHVISCSSCPVFTLCWGSMSSLKKTRLHPGRSILTLKIRSFLAIQIVQHIRIIASMKNWELSWIFNWAVCSGKLLPKGMSMLIMSQHIFLQKDIPQRDVQLILPPSDCTRHSYRNLDACFFFSVCFWC